jgi:hypothetical protein
VPAAGRGLMRALIVDRGLLDRVHIGPLKQAGLPDRYGFAAEQERGRPPGRGRAYRWQALSLESAQLSRL